jgi:UDP-N-acetylglucosamine 2-epimerase (non-hydrolysing)
MDLERIEMFKKIAICFGTRPEIIKLSLLSQKMSKAFDVVNVFTNQHHSLYDDVKHLIPNIHYSLPIGEYENLTLLYADLTKNLYGVFNNVKPDLVIVQGDTATSYCAAFCAFIMGIKVGHVEAGLRTSNVYSPFPEEFNRQSISKIAYYNWCPSERAACNLRNEMVGGKIIITGNPIVDFVKQYFDLTKVVYGNDVVITFHRRENKDIFESILYQINIIAHKNPDLTFVFPVHPNPIIRNQIKILDATNIVLCPPMKYENFIELLMRCKGIITDSGGIQEEAVCFRKKVLVCRDTTERQEVVNIGISKLVGSKVEENFNWLLSTFDGNIINPYGDGSACEKIIESL